MKHQLFYGSSLFLAFIIGCAASSQVVPAVRAQAPVESSTEGNGAWEYRCVDGRNNMKLYDLTRAANDLAPQGWEMVGVGSKTVDDTPTGRVKIVPVGCFERKAS